MCRKNQLLGFVLAAFGFGILIGLWLESGFMAHCLGFGVVVIGCGIMKKK